MPKKLPDNRVREIRITAKNGNFKDLVAVLERTLVIKDLPGIRGCAPCRSGLDRIVIEAPEIHQFLR